MKYYYSIKKYSLERMSIWKAARTLKLPDYLADRAINSFKQYTESTAPFCYLKGAWFRNCTKSILAAACLLVACKTDPLCEPITLRDIARAFNFPPFFPPIGKYYRKIIMNQDEKAQACLYNPLLYVDRMLDSSTLSAEEKREVRERVQALYLKVRKSQVSRNPKIVAAGLLYYILGYEDGRFSQVAIAKMAGITDVAVRSRFRGIKWSLEEKVIE